MKKVFNDLPKDYADLLDQLINKTLQTQETFTWALSGGNTPKMIFEELAKHHHDSIPWERVLVFWGDERCVPPDDNESNYYHACKHLLCHVPIPRENIFRMKGEEDPRMEAKRYGELIDKNVKKSQAGPQLDLNMLGIGTDGHTASIFPQQEHLFDSVENCVVGVHPQSGQKRITLTGRVLNNAKNIHIIASGPEKAGIVKEVMEGKGSYPVHRIRKTEGFMWILDEGAV